MSPRSLLVPILAACLGAAAASADRELELELRMPQEVFSPGMLCRLELGVRNSGESIPKAELYVALDLGAGDYWFHPSWCRFPDQLDWEETSFPAGCDQIRTILPDFIWPVGPGSGEGGRFVAAALVEGRLVGDIATCSFSWSEAPMALFAFVPPGLYRVGSPPDERCRYPVESLHDVILTRGFLIQETEVTQSEWTAVFGSNPSRFVGSQRPVEHVSWFECCLYCNRLSRSRGLRPCYYEDAAFQIVLEGDLPVAERPVHWDRSAGGYRLPTESEWEIACRAGTDAPYNSGAENLSCIGVDENLDVLAWYAQNCNETAEVGLKEPNALGLQDMHGNVWEWCWDLYGSYPEVSATDPAGPETGSGRVERGGCWASTPRWSRSAIRNRSSGIYRGPDLGFRPVLTQRATRKPIPS